MDNFKDNSKVKNCEFCSEQFIYKQKTQRFCDREHFSNCEVCKDSFSVKRPVSYPRACSRKCSSKLIYIDRAKEVSIDKKCAFCHDEFTTSNERQKYCTKEHSRDCEVCGEIFIIKKLHAPSRTCSQSCGSSLTHSESSREARKANSIKKHGTEHPFQADSIKDKIKASLDNSENDTRFGSEKFKAIIKEKYNVENVSQLDSIKLKKAETSMRNYGVDNPMKSEEVQNIRRELRVEKQETESITQKEFEMLGEEWFTVEDIELSESTDKLYCISVDSPEKQFLIGEMGVPTHNTDEAKEADELKGEAIMIIGSIARLGRASGVHLVVATQRPDAKLIPGEVRDNLAVRVGCGRLKPSASLMMFDSGIGQRVHASPRGGMYVQIHGTGNMGQGFFAPNSWIDEYWEKHGLADSNEESSAAEIVEDLDDTMKKADKEFTEYWDSRMEELHEAGD